MILTFRYRLLPSRRQHRALEEILESQRQLYNAALEERIDAYRKARINRTYFDQTLALTEWRRSDPDARKMPVMVQRATLNRLDDAFGGYFRRISRGESPGHPRFRGKGWYRSFGFRQFLGIKLERGSLRFKGMPGRLRIHLHRELPPEATIRACTFKLDGGTWHVAFAVAVDSAKPRRGSRGVGVDLGITTFAALSDGGHIPSLRAARRAERKVRLAQRALARKARGSRGRKRSRSALAKCYRQVRRQRSHHLHAASARLVRDYDLIAVERLPVKGLSGGFLAKHVLDAGWGGFLAKLRYKAERAGVRLVEVDPFDTSQDCSDCGSRVPKRLEDRVHRCSSCGLELDRDLNAARNVLRRAGVGPGLLNAVT